MNAHLRQFALIASAALALTSTDSVAIDPGACCAPQTSRVDALMNPVKGGDERFFAATGSPTTVMFLVGTYQSMRDYVTPLPSGGALGCTNAGNISGMLAFYDKADALRNGLTPIDADGTLPTRFFEPTQFYASTRSKLREGGGSFDSFNTGDFTRVNQIGTSAATACALVPGLTAGERTTCEGCVNVATGPGWFRKDDDEWLLGGAVLNANPPKFVTTRAVVKDVAGSLSNVRIGFSAFNRGTGDMYDPPRIPMRASPTCANLNPIDSAAVLTSVKTSINSLPFTGTERQIGEALFGIGGYFSTKTQWETWFDSATYPANYPGGTSWGFSQWTDDTSAPNTIIWGAGEEMCSECQATMVIVLTDGTPDGDNTVPVSKMMSLLIADGARHPDGTLLTFNANVDGTCPNNNTANGGINFCDRFGVDKCDCDPVAAGPSGPDTTNKNFMDDVAFFLANIDLRPDLASKQTVKTYTIGLGDNSPMLQSIAYAGGGLFYSANNAAQLKSAVIAAITDVQSKTTGFSGASVAAVQTGTSEAILPRLFPRADKPWIGSLWRFEMYNEFVEGVSITDGGLNNVVMIDDAGAKVTEDLVNGTFVKTGSALAADKFWEAGDRLVTLGHMNRNMWTVIDDCSSTACTGGDGAFTSADTLTEFSMANRATLQQYLGVLGTPFCPVEAGSQGTMLNSLGLTATQLATLVNTAYATTVVATPTTQAELNALCVAGLILYMRGADLIDEDGDTDRLETRRSVLADIFHSTPVSVVPPVDPFLCELGIVNQCARTLFSQTLGVAATDLATYASEQDCAATTVSRNAYEAWAYRNRKREKTVLVGSNDGVLHAFANGTATETCPGGASTLTYNQGTGREIWGFIPPDQLSRLQDQFSGHTYGVDGDVMVRDIWADNSGTLVTGANGIKERDEFHTVAIAAEGRGGTHYFAVEVDYNVTSGQQTTVRDRPKFLWMFPQPCSEEAARFGKTLSSISPKAPPIGPVLTRASSNTKSRYGFDTKETWMVALSGGWSPGREKGRGIYVVDAYKGQVNGRTDNLWWKFEFDDNASGDLAPATKLGQSVTSPVAMVDFGANSEPRQDGFFDTAVFGDVQGQLWVARLFEPAVVDTSPPYLVTNWRAGRAFEMDRDGVPAAPAADPDGDVDDPVARSAANRHPFYYLPSIVIEPGTNLMRAFIGTGERYSILDAPDPVCRFDNPLACAKAQCDDVKVRYRFSGPLVDNRLETRFKKRQFSAGRYTSTPRSLAVCGTAGSDNVDARFDHYKVRRCAMTDTTTADPGTLNDSRVSCQMNSASTSYSCNYVASPTILSQDLLNRPLTDVAGLGKNRYIGVLVYGGSRVFTEGTNTAVAYDTARLTDRGDLVDVSSTTCTGPANCTGPTANGNGWFLDYDVQATKTATGSAVLASCVLFNTLTPASGSGASCAAGAGSPEARLFQANFLTGAPDCAEGFLDAGVSQRYISRNVVAPPPEPASAIQVSKSGQVRYSAMVIEPGQTTSVNVTNGQDSLQLVYEVPISRALHECRHNDGGCVVVP